MDSLFLQKLKEEKPQEVVYKRVGERELHLYIFPPQEKVNGCVIHIHGGGWRAETPQRLYPHANYFSQNEGLGICVEYRLHDITQGRDVRECLEDCVDALVFIRNYVRENYGNIPLTALGDSAGGYLAVCLGCQSIIRQIRKNVERVNFVVDLNGIVDLTGKWNYAIERKANDTEDEVVLQRRYSPLFNVENDDAEVLLMHGDEDEIVAIEDAQAYYAELQNKRVASELMVIPNAKHAFILFDYAHENEFVLGILYRIADFLRLKKML